MDKKSSTIECIWRRYRIKTGDDDILYVESTNPRSEQEELSEIDSFFSNFQIVSIDQEVQEVEVLDIDNNDSLSKVEAKSVHIPEQVVFSPRQRFNILLKMKGEFTSKDYRDYMLEEYNVKLGKDASHDDISIAIKSERIEMLEEKSGRFRLYKVIDSSSVNDTLYLSISKENKIKMEAISR
jgi:hypothetical protein